VVPWTARGGRVFNLDRDRCSGVRAGEGGSEMSPPRSSCCAPTSIDVGLCGVVGAFLGGYVGSSTELVAVGVGAEEEGFWEREKARDMLGCAGVPVSSVSRCAYAKVELNDARKLGGMRFAAAADCEEDIEGAAGRTTERADAGEAATAG
jgi:hypothetical protein